MSAGINAAVIAQSRVVDGLVFDGMVQAILSALWESRRPEDVDLAGLGFTPDQIARLFDAAVREARQAHDADRVLQEGRPAPRATAVGDGQTPPPARRAASSG